MTAISDNVQIAICEELSYGVTPDNPEFYVCRLTGETLDSGVATTVLNPLDPRRQSLGSFITSSQSTGDISFELAFEPWLDLVVEGVMADDWSDISGGSAIQIGNLVKSFTVERRILVADGETQYHRFTGMVVDSFNLRIRPSSLIECSVGFIGRPMQVSQTALIGASYMTPLGRPVVRSANVVDITLGSIPAISRCFEELSITLSNALRVIERFGTLGPDEIMLGRADVTASFSVLFSDSDLHELLASQDESSLSFSTTDSVFAQWTWLLPQTLLTSSASNAQGKEQDIVVRVNARAFLDESSGTSFRITESIL